MKKIINNFLNHFGYQIVSKKIFDKLSDIPNFIYLWNQLDLEQREFISPYIAKSRSQYLQDLFVISQIQKRNIPKYFVEFGATNGINFSNTYCLEKYFNWSGILAEPARVWHDDLYTNRSCIIDKRCVYTISGESLEFFETLNPNTLFENSSPELSVLKKYLESDDWAQNIRKQNSIEYMVESVSLNDLLLEHDAPSHIGYMSIDTEGGELQILENFNFINYRIEIISIEHNSNPLVRESIKKFLTNFGYNRVYDDLFCADDIYIIDKRE